MNPILVVDFDGLLNPMPEGWFDVGAYQSQPVRDAIEFLVNATEFFEVCIYGPRTLMFGGIQTMQAAIIFWTTMISSKDTMHDLMRILNFPDMMPDDWSVHINTSGVNLGPAKDLLSQDCLDFINYWQTKLAAATATGRRK